MKHPREVIRKYIGELVKKAVGQTKVFVNRPSPYFLNELPAVGVHYGQESSEIFVGDSLNISQYVRKLPLFIDIFTEAPILGEDSDPTQTTKSDDYLDGMAYKIESELTRDPQLARLNPNYDPDKRGQGLVESLELASTTPYSIDTDSSTQIWILRLNYTVTYYTDERGELKLKDFSDYLINIYEVENGTKTDNLLTSAEGTI